jgi:hypothetical protein
MGGCLHHLAMEHVWRDNIPHRIVSYFCHIGTHNARTEKTH